MKQLGGDDDIASCPRTMSAHRFKSEQNSTASLLPHPQTTLTDGVNIIDAVTKAVTSVDHQPADARAYRLPREARVLARAYCRVVSVACSSG